MSILPRFDREALASDLRLARLAAKGAYVSAYLLRDGSKMSPGILVEKYAVETPDRMAILFEDQRYTYAQFNARASQVANALTALGAQAGDTIALLMDNRPEYVMALTGANKLGITSALINTHVTGHQLEHALKICDPQWILVGSEHVHSLEEVAATLPVPRDRVLVWSEGEVKSFDGGRDFNPLVDAASTANPSVTGTFTVETPCCYIYTSGTTGLPKAALMKNGRFLKAAYMFGKVVVGLTPDDVVYQAGLPFYHSSGAVLGWATALTVGCTCVIRRKFSASHHFEDCVRYDVTVFYYIGEFCRYLLNSPVGPYERKHKVRAILGAGLRPDIWQAFVDRFGIPKVFEFYGATEGNVGIVNIDSKPGMLGRLLPGQLVVAVDDETGEIVRDADGRCTKVGPGGYGMLLGMINKINSFDGYVDKSKNDSKIVVDPFGDGKNYFNTGDLVDLHERRYVSFKDRMGDTFRWKAENVSTNDVQEVLTTCDGVSEAVVYGVQVPHADGRAGMAALVVDEGQFDADRFAEHVCANLPAYSRPLFLRFEKELKITASFKYVKTHLKEEGYDPAKCGGEVLFLDGSRYVPLTQDLIGQIERADLRL